MGMGDGVERGRECGPKAEPKRGCDSVERGWNLRPQADPDEEARLFVDRWWGMWDANGWNAS